MIEQSRGKELLTRESDALIGSLLDRTVTRIGSSITNRRGVIAITLTFDDETTLEVYIDKHGMACGPVRVTHG